MYLKNITINNFKNLINNNLCFSPNLNCFVGDNGEGKTNILDAIYYLSITKSFFNSIDLQNINYGKDFFSINGIYERNDIEEKIFCGVKCGENKIFKRNDKIYTRIHYIPALFVSLSACLVDHESARLCCDVTGALILASLLSPAFLTHSFQGC